MIAWLGVYALHSTLLLGGVWLVDRCWRGASPAFMAGLWRMALVAAVLTASLQTFGFVQPIAAPVVVPAAVAEALAATTPPADFQAAPAAPIIQEPSIAWPQLVLLLWLVGAGLLALRAGLGWAAFRRAIAGRSPLPDGALSALVQDMGRRAALNGLRVSLSETIPCPLALPGREICLPAGIEHRFSGRQLEAMLAHEMAHLARRDVFWLGIAQAMGVLFFFQPMNLLARRRMAALAEFAADDWARTHTGGGRALAECLARFAQDAAPGPLAAYSAPMATEQAGIVPRVRRLLTGPHSTGLLPRAAAAGLGLAALGLAVVLPGIAAQARPPAAAEETPASLALAAAKPAGPARAGPAPSASPVEAPFAEPIAAASDGGDVLAQLRAAGGLRWDSKTRVALEAVDLTRPLPGEAFAAYVDVAAGIGSDSEMHKALRPLVLSPETPGAQVLRAIQLAGRKIGSDSELSNLLTAAAPRVGASPALAEAYIEASRTIASDGEQADALVDLTRLARLDGARREQLRAIAGEIPSRAHRERLLAASSGS